MYTITKTCTVCNIQFSVHHKYQSKLYFTRNTCSKQCEYRLKGQILSQPKKHKTFTCKQCNKTFKDLTIRNRIFCNYTCKSLWQKENLLAENNPNWKSKLERIPYLNVKRSIRSQLLREREVCEICKSAINLQVHHIDKDRLNNIPTNLILLCQEHHAQEHENDGERVTAILIRNHPQSTGKTTIQPRKCRFCKILFHPNTRKTRFCSNECVMRFKYNSPYSGNVCICCKRTFRRNRRIQNLCSISCRSYYLNT